MARLSLLNYLNVIAYIANVAIVYGIGSLGLFGFNTNGELSAKYQTLVTPIGLTFLIWAIIFIFQLIFVVAQLLPVYRATPMVATAIGYDYVGVCISQIAWTFAFTYEIIWLSLAFMAAILVFLLKIVTDQYKQSSLEKTSIRDYWLLKFPFSIHCGWILAAFMVNLSAVLVSQNVEASIQYYVALVTLAILVAISLFSLGFPSRPDYVIPIVLAWASIGIYRELGSPNDLITSSFSADRIASVRMGALVSMSMILAAVVVRVILQIVCSRRRASGAEDEGNDGLDDGKSNTSKGSKKSSTLFAADENV